MDEGYIFKRVCVDFDPLVTQICHAIVCFYKHADGGTIHENQPVFVAFCENEQEANQIAERMKNGEHKDFAEKKYTFDRVEVITSLITAN